ncbi:MAG TPA: hypothetical protein VI338_02285 [Nitrososphaera sp.]|nr:hypothetical protein [Nitrososphaera sp.]
MKSLGLDLSLLSTGVCVVSGDSCDNASVQTNVIKCQKIKGVEQGIERLIYIAREISSVISDENPDCVVIEAPAKNQVWQAASIGELHGMVKCSIFQENNIVPLVEQATKMRKQVVGQIPRTFVETLDKKGKPKKSVSYGMIPGKRGPRKATIKDIIETRLAERGFVFPSQDEMDAYVAARYGFDMLLENKIGDR